MPESSPTVRRRRLGLILRELRLAGRLTGEEVGQRVERSASWVSRVEHGRVGLRSRDLNDLLDALKVTSKETRAELTQLARESKHRGWWNRYGQTVTGPYASFISFEHEASDLRSYEGIAINGLLQTEEYARALLEHGIPRVAGEDADRHVGIRMRRQQRLREQNPPSLWIILEESVLHRPFGGSAVMRRQLQHLLDLAEGLPHLSIQVLPFNQTLYVGLIASFWIISFPPPDRDIVFTEGMNGMAMEEEADARAYTLIFDELRAAALSKADSLTLIRDTMHKIK
ncbi:helix-turn-helix domain-containing protein [Micromonospora chokoriensis]